MKNLKYVAINIFVNAFLHLFIINPYNFVRIIFPQIVFLILLPSLQRMYQYFFKIVFLLLIDNLRKRIVFTSQHKIPMFRYSSFNRTVYLIILLLVQCVIDECLH